MYFSLLTHLLCRTQFSLPSVLWGIFREVRPQTSRYPAIVNLETMIYGIGEVWI